MKVHGIEINIHEITDQSQRANLPTLSGNGKWKIKVEQSSLNSWEGTIWRDCMPGQNNSSTVNTIPAFKICEFIFISTYTEKKVVGHWNRIHISLSAELWKSKTPPDRRALTFINSGTHCWPRKGLCSHQWVWILRWELSTLLDQNKIKHTTKETIMSNVKGLVSGI